MGGRGPVPGTGAKDPAVRVRRNKPTPVVELGAPPEEYPEFPWEGALDQTLEWYRALATSPQASRFLATDWTRIHQVAVMIDAFYGSVLAGAPKFDLLPEIRRQEAQWGMTVADRLRLHWEAPQQNTGRPVPTGRLRPRLRVVDDQGKGQVAGR